VPFGAWSVDSFQRIYDESHLDDLLEGWTIVDQRTFVQADRDRWLPVTTAESSSTWDPDKRGVALLRASPG
jgi:hypothetical protein